MKKLLYISNIEVPYRVKFFNELSKCCDLTVLYEREKSSNRDSNWVTSEKANYKTKYLHGPKLRNEYSLSLGILKHIFTGYDCIIIGCYNSPIQMLAILAMRLFRIPYIINLDGEPFINGSGIKSKVKRFLISGADKCLVAGEKSADTVKSVIKNAEVYPYYFSSLSDCEIKENTAVNNERQSTVLVVGQYFDYKGLDIAIAAAKMDTNIKYKFIGTGNRTELFINELHVDQLSNVEVVPFLPKDRLNQEYQTCSLLVLPSRQECWGLVVNEAAAFGTPIVSTKGSGAAVEFLSDGFSKYLSEPGDSKDLYSKIKAFFDAEDTNDYQQYLRNKSLNYSIEKQVKAHIDACDL